MREKLWRAAFAQTLPVLAGYLFLGFAYGVLMRHAGFSPLWAVGMSIFVYAGSMQYAAVPVLAGAFDPVGALLLSIMVNARHMFYGVSMLGRYRRAGKWAPYLIFSLTDETFSVNVAAKVPQGVDETAFYVAASALDHAYWVGATLLGAMLGGVLTLEVKGIEFVMTALFVTIFTDQCYFITKFYIWNICYIDHKLVHTNSSADWCFFAMDQYITFVRKTSGISISVADRNGRKRSLFFCHIGSAIADRSSFRNCLYIRDMTDQFHGRF